jgi:hypothetical protein
MLTKEQFFKKYLWYFNLYGNLCFLGAVLCCLGVFFFIKQSILHWQTGSKLTFWLFVTLALGFLIGIIACLSGGIEISRRLKDKYRFYRITTKRALKNGFFDDFFAEGFGSPCYRLVIRQILSDFGMEKEYHKFKRKILSRFVVLESIKIPVTANNI